MSATVEAIKRLELQNQAHRADELLRMAIGVARRYDAATHLSDPEKPVVKLDLNEVKALADQKYGTN